MTNIASANDCGKLTWSTASSKRDVTCSLSDVGCEAQRKKVSISIFTFMGTATLAAVLAELHFKKPSERACLLAQIHYSEQEEEEAFLLLAAWSSHTPRIHQLPFALPALSAYVHQ